jgi:hypothetical protein
MLTRQVIEAPFVIVAGSGAAAAPSPPPPPPPPTTSNRLVDQGGTCNAGGTVGERDLRYACIEV